MIDKNEFDSNMLPFLNKKVEIIYKNEKWSGILKFAGISSLHGQYQVTLDRHPCWPVDPNTIKLI